MSKKKTTPKSSPNHRSSDQYSKNGTINKSFARVTPLYGLFYNNPKSFIYEPSQQVFCLEEHFLNHGLLPAVVKPSLLEQFLLIECSVGCSHYVDISQHMYELELEGHPIGNLRLWSPRYFLDLDGFYVRESGGAANDELTKCHVNPGGGLR